jgi:hypothetical protein
MEELKTAVREAVSRASEAAATLVFAFIGHAETRADVHSPPLFLLPTDGSATAPGTDTAYKIGDRLSELDGLPSLDGLILILDTCHAGRGVQDVIRSSLDLKAQVRLELLAGTFLREAREGCFSQSLIQLMERGLPGFSGDYLDIRQAANVAAETCTKKQDPPVYIGSGFGKNSSDPGLWITRNVASPEYWPLSGTAEGAHAVALTTSFQATHDLDKVVHALGDQHVVVVQGGAGTGKSCLIAALARPELVPDLPRKYLSAVAFTALTPDLADLAQSLHRQLALIPGFPEAVATYELSVGSEEQDRQQPPLPRGTATGIGGATEPVSSSFQHRGAGEVAQLDKQPALERLVFGPLRHLKVPLLKRIRLAIDGIDQIDAGLQHEIVSAVTAAGSDEHLQKVAVLLGTRGEVSEQQGVHLIRLSPPAQDEVMEYLEGLGLGGPLAAVVSVQVKTWLELRLWVGALAVARGTSSADTPVDELYGQNLQSLTGGDPDGVRILLAVLGAAGTGPILPGRIAAHACFQLGLREEARFRHTVSALGSLIARADPGTPQEHLGLFHDTLAQHIQNRSDWPISSHQAHMAILTAMEAIQDPASEAYRRQRRSEHLWAVGQHEEAIKELIAGVGYRAADNRDLLQGWTHRAEQVLPVENRTLLKLKLELANWHGKAGSVGSAQDLLRDLLQTQLSFLDPDHPDVLATRSDLAKWTGVSGDVAEALRQYRDLLQARLEVLGRDHQDTLDTRGDIAYWTWESGDKVEAARQFGDLLQDQLRVLGPDHSDTQTTRHNLAAWTGESGDAVAAARQFRELLEDQLRTIAPDHPDILSTRDLLASWTGASGDAAEAVRQFHGVLQDRLRVLGPDHPDTLSTRDTLACWIGAAGDAAEAVRQLRDVLPDRLRVLGPDHPHALSTRDSLACWTGSAGDAAEAVRQLRDVLQDRLRVLGPDHPDTVSTRESLASWTGELGDAAEAARLYRDVLQDRLRIFAPDRPETLTTRHNLASWTGESGDAAAAARLYRDVVQDRLRVLGPDYPDTLSTRHNLAHWIGESGDAAEAARLLRDVVQDQLRVLGPDHADTLNTRHSLASWTGKSGDVAEGARLFREVLQDRIRVLGPDHPDTLTNRHQVAHYAWLTGDTEGAVHQFQNLLEDLRRILGPDHPSTQFTRKYVDDMTNYLANMTRESEEDGGPVDIETDRHP